MVYQGPYNDVILERAANGQIGIIKFNRPKSLNSFGGKLMEETVAAIRELNDDPTSIFTVLTGSGRFFSAGADVRSAGLDAHEEYANAAEKKLAYLHRFLPALEMLRGIIDHKKVFVVALNGPAVGGGAAWFTGMCDILFASSSCWLQVPFSQLGLVPENGSALTFAQSMGIHRANEFLMFGAKLTAQELKDQGMVNQIFEHEGFHEKVTEYLTNLLAECDGKSMCEMKRLQNVPMRDARLVAVANALDALAERFVEGAPTERFIAKKALLESKSKNRTSKI